MQLHRPGDEGPDLCRTHVQRPVFLGADRLAGGRPVALVRREVPVFPCGEARETFEDGLEPSWCGLEPVGQDQGRQPLDVGLDASVVLGPGAGGEDVVEVLERGVRPPGIVQCVRRVEQLLQLEGRQR